MKLRNRDTQLFSKRVNPAPLKTRNARKVANDQCQKKSSKENPASTLTAVNLNIKQEESTERIVIGNPSETALGGSKNVTYESDCIEHIKQEDTVKKETLLKTVADLEFEPSDKDYYYCCPKCLETSVNLKSVLEHRESVHGIKGKVAIKHVALEPDLYDSNHYCKCCESKFASLKSYWGHLRNVHLMRLKPLRFRRSHAMISSTQVHNSSSNKFNDFQNYYQQKQDSYSFHCRACDKSLPSETSYRHHLLSAHAIDQDIPKESSVPDVDAVDNFCRVCKLQLVSNAAYRRHLRFGHKMILQPLWKTLYDPKLLPDPLDSNFYCRVCQLRKKNSLEYRKHCISEHRITLAPVTPFAYPDAVVNPESPDYFCAKCNKRLKSSITFRAHLKRVHHIIA